MTDNIEPNGAVNPNYQKRINIINNTPSGYDPLVYWHQVAQDAIHSRERELQNKQERTEELERLRRYEQNERKRVEYELREQTFPSVRELLSRVKDGDFSINISIGIYPNREGGTEND